MKLVGKQDRLLLLGLVVALVVVFARPIRYVFEIVYDVEKSSGLALLPALVILAVVFVVHLQGKRVEAKARASAAEAEAVQAEARAFEMERLVEFGQALGRSLDVDAIRDVLLQQLSWLSGSRDAWVLVRDQGEWRELIAPANQALSDDLRGAAARTRQDLATRALMTCEQGLPRDPLPASGHYSIPLTAGGSIVGVLGVPEAAGPLAGWRHRTISAAATLLAASIRNAQLFREVREHSLRDGLTGCFNRTHALEVIAAELRRARRSQAPVSLIIFDLDHFKQINDRHGHLCGDAVLAAVGRRMHDVLRGSDLKCRYGGEEFVVLLPDTPMGGARRVAEALRRDLADIAIEWNGERLRITASFGVAAALPSEVDVEALIGRADQALYRAKDQGRNCVRLAMDAVAALREAES